MEPVLEDNPLAVCDARSIDPEDLIATDRVIPVRAGEVYYLRYNKNQRWHWLENMTIEEPLVMLMFDTHSEDQANCNVQSSQETAILLIKSDCPHVSFDNPRASENATKRHSIETRSVVISAIP